MTSHIYTVMCAVEMTLTQLMYCLSSSECSQFVMVVDITDVTTCAGSVGR